MKRIFGIMMMLAMTTLAACGSGNVTELAAVPTKPVPIQNNNSQKDLVDSAPVVAFIKIFTGTVVIPFSNVKNDCIGFGESVKALENPGFWTNNVSSGVEASKAELETCTDKPEHYGVVKYTLVFKDAALKIDPSLKIKSTVMFILTDTEGVISLEFFFNGPVDINGKSYDFSKLQIAMKDMNKDNLVETPECGGTVTIDGKTYTISEDCNSIK